MNDSNQPTYSFETAKQLVFDCAMELNYGTENLSKEIVAAKLLNIIDELDKMQVVNKSDIHVYCTHCAWFQIKDGVPDCKYSEECDLWDCEDSRPFSERPKYQLREDILLSLDKMLKDLKIYGNCALCIHYDTIKCHCEFGGCCGGGNGKIKEDKWEYRYNE